ncbi:universal stress protein [Halogranum amylolyticum]|uniref:universal stress protein n=1 Tax=Halogranum amylolyticum TaxID=660520 RepID=UPI000AC7A8D2|nr:universal stress protein [Halogranum amylolyticum]
MSVETILLGASDQDVEQLTDVAIEVAKPLDATVVVAHILPTEVSSSTNTSPVVGTLSPYVVSENEYETLLDEHSVDDYPPDEYAATNLVSELSSVREITTRLDDADVEYDVRGAVGDPGEGLVALTNELDADRVIISGRRRSPTGKALFGSVTQSVLLNSPCPVTFVRVD